MPVFTEKPLPYGNEFASPDEYIEELLDFTKNSDLFQIFCGGIHVIDFFTTDPGCFYRAVPEEWQEFLLKCPPMRLIDLILREDLDNLKWEEEVDPPSSFLDYVRCLKKLSLRRSFDNVDKSAPRLARSVTVGMKSKKIHEVTNFANYVQRLSETVQEKHAEPVSHFVDFGSGQNYLGRALASEPYNRHVVAVEGRDSNVVASRALDMTSGLAAKPKVLRNKKLWNQVLQKRGKDGRGDPQALARAIESVEGTKDYDFRSHEELEAVYTAEQGKGYVHYVSDRLDSGDLTEVMAKIEQVDISEEEKNDPRLMAVSIHSCGNLSHFGIRSLILNPSIQGIAIVGCCYNLLTDRLGPPQYKHPYLRPKLQAENGRVSAADAINDPQGFPMSERFANYQDHGIRLNITARMMACQAPANWSVAESEEFFTKHFYRSVFQRILLDRGVVRMVRHHDPDSEVDLSVDGPFDISSTPVIIGSLGKKCFASFKTYVRGAVQRLVSNETNTAHADMVREKMEGITDEEIEQYEKTYAHRKMELSSVWTLMATSAMVAESAIVADRWTFLQEHDDIVEKAWVEAVFDYEQSPRNLVVVGIKRASASGQRQRS